MQPYIEEAIDFLREQHPDILMIASYTLNEAYPKVYVARNMQVALGYTPLHAGFEEFWIQNST